MIVPCRKTNDAGSLVIFGAFGVDFGFCWVEDCVLDKMQPTFDPRHRRSGEEKAAAGRNAKGCTPGHIIENEMITAGALPLVQEMKRDRGRKRETTDRNGARWW